MTPALLLVLLLQIKHLVADGFLQTRSMVLSKAAYGRGLGLLHAGVHGVGTFVALMVFGTGLGLGVTVAAADAVIHYHADYIKENIVRAAGWTVADRQFWWAQMSDQFVHALTYIAIAAYVAGR